MKHASLACGRQPVFINSVLTSFALHTVIISFKIIQVTSIDLLLQFYSEVMFFLLLFQCVAEVKKQNKKAKIPLGSNFMLQLFRVTMSLYSSGTQLYEQLTQRALSHFTCMMNFSSFSIWTCNISCSILHGFAGTEALPQQQRNLPSYALESQERGPVNNRNNAPQPKEDVIS